MKHFLRCILIAIAVLAVSCTDSNDEDCYYEDCTTMYPTEGTLSVKVNFDALNPSVPIRIYAGYYGVGELITEDTLYGEKKDYLLPTGVFYSVAANYKTEQGSMLVIGGDKIDVKSRKECDSTCYTVKDAYVKVKLKD